MPLAQLYHSQPNTKYVKENITEVFLAQLYHSDPDAEYTMQEDSRGALSKKLSLLTTHWDSQWGSKWLAG